MKNDDRVKGESLKLQHAMGWIGRKVRKTVDIIPENHLGIDWL